MFAYLAAIFSHSYVMIFLAAIAMSGVTYSAQLDRRRVQRQTRPPVAGKQWPEAEMDEATFLTELLKATNAALLLDVSNLYANSHNHRYDALDFLARVPLGRIAYVHVGGGTEQEGIYLDTHTDPVVPAVLKLVEELCALTTPPGVMLERDDDFPAPVILAAELSAIAAAVDAGRKRQASGDSN